MWGCIWGTIRMMPLGSIQPPPLGLSLLCCPAGSPWTRRPGLERCLSSAGLLLLPNLPVPQLPTGKQPLLPGETEAGRHQTCPRLLFVTELEREARSPGSCVHLHPKLIYKVDFPCRAVPVTCGVASATGSPFAGPARWGLHPHPAPAPPAGSHPCLAACPQPQFPFSSKGIHPLQRQTRHCRVPQFTPCRSSALGHLAPSSAGTPGTLPGTARLSPSGSQHLTSPGSRALARGRSCLCRTNGINQNKRQRACFYLLPIQGFETHLQASTAIWRRGTHRGHPGRQEKAGPAVPTGLGCGPHTTGHPFVQLCPWASPPSPHLGSWGHLPISRSFSALCITPPSCSSGLHRSPATHHLGTMPGCGERREDEERGASACPK